jgi:hypothetical protein
MSSTRERSILLRTVLFLAIVGIAVVVGYFIMRPSDALPIYHPAQLDPRLVDPELKGVQGEHHIADFRLVDQFGGNFTLNDVGDRIVVADFFFTTCATICPKMTDPDGTRARSLQGQIHARPTPLPLRHPRNGFGSGACGLRRIAQRRSRPMALPHRRSQADLRPRSQELLRCDGRGRRRPRRFRTH